MNKYDINKYLERKYSAFKIRFESKENPCTLKELNYGFNNIPNYNDFDVRTLYILRYTYAYYFAYRQMYKNLLRFTGSIDKIKVLSIGCGNMIDYYSLRDVLNWRNLEKTIIEYTGVDKVKWWGEIKKAHCDTIIAENKDIKSFISKNYTAFDIYICPMSLSEIGKNTLMAIVENIAKNSIGKKAFYILFLVRKNNDKEHDDDKKIKALKRKFEELGYEITKSINRFNTLDNTDNYPRYPNDIKEYLKEMKTHCPKHNKKSEILCKECKINREAMRYFKSYTSLEILEFKRKQIL